MKFDFKAILDWVRRHVFIVVFCVIIIAAPIVGWLIGGSLKRGVLDDLNARKGDLDALVALETTTVTLNVPGREAISLRGVVNKPLLDSYGEMVESLRRDADAVREEALRHNSKGRDVLMPGIFPKPPLHKIQTIHEEFYPVVVDAYMRLLADVGAGMPPAAAGVRSQLLRRSSQFIASVGGGKRSVSELSPEDRARHDQDLVRARKSIYAEAASAISIYASPESIGMPPPPVNVGPAGVPLDRMFEWNWNFWITEDIVRALADANEGSGSVIRAPVKRILGLRIRPLPRDGQDGTAAGSIGAGGEVVGGNPVDPRVEVQRDFSGSLTGRATNDLYDVREVRLDLVIQTDALPRIADALARRNFITITNLTLKPADPFAAAREGFIYGAEPVSEVTLFLEIVQLREWTTLRMPAELKARLRTQGVGAGSAADGADDAVSGS